MHQILSTRRQRRKPRRFKPEVQGPVSLIGFIEDLGGIDPAQPEAGDLRAMDAHKIAQSRPGICKLVRKRPGEGRKIDYIRKLAQEAGYLPEGSGINDLLEAIDLEIRGIRRTYALADVDAVPLPPGAEPPEPQPAKRGVGRPRKPGGAMIGAPAFRLDPGDLARLERASTAHRESLRAFARRCLLLGLGQLDGEGF